MKISLLLASASLLAFASTAYGSDLMVDGPGPIQYADPAPSHGWDGAYVGAFGGYTWAHLDDGSDGLDPEGWLLGVNAGANFTLDNGIVVGVVGDIAWSNASDSLITLGTVTTTIDWLGSVRGRVGFDAGGFLPYLTAGLAFAHNSIESTLPAGDDQTHVGWTVGAGVEVAVADNISLDLLYRYSDYGTADYAVPGGTDLGLTSHQVTGGINFGF